MTFLGVALSRMTLGVCKPPLADFGGREKREVFICHHSMMQRPPGGPPLETLPPLEARAVLANAQAAVPVDLSGIEESETTIHADGYTIPLNIVRPAGATGTLSVFIFIHG